MTIPLQIEVFDKTFKQVGTVGNPKFATAIPRFMAPGLFTFAIAASHRMVSDLVADGARVRVLDAAGEHVMSGTVSRFAGVGPEAVAMLEFSVVDDFAILQQVLGWVVPTAGIDQQGTAGSNWTMTGAAETVLKTAVKQNAVDRLGLPITIPTTQGRGAPVSARLRFQPLYDRLFPVEDGAGIAESGIGVGLRQSGSGLVLDVWEPQTYLKPLNEKSGIVQDWSYSHQRATTTRVVVGGQGEAQLRVFRSRVDAAREAAQGWKRESWRDARDTNDPNVLYARADETLFENGPKTGLSITLAETANFAYGSAYKVGDRVTLDVGGLLITERLQECTLSWTADGGFVSRPRVGERSDDPDRTLAKRVVQLARTIRNRNTET